MKKAKPTPVNEGEPKFEEALAQLEEIVQQLEAGEAPLEESLAAYEEGIGLVKRCQQLLDQVELRVQKLTGVSPEGEAESEPFEN